MKSGQSLAFLQGGLYGITDACYFGPDWRTPIRQALDAGLQALQLRHKSASTAQFLRLGRQIQALMEPYRVPLIINDRLDIALALQAEGLHIGGQDLPLAKVRKLWPGLLGVTAPTAQSIQEAVLGGADYVGSGPVFLSSTKDPGRPSLGISGIAELVHPAPLPLVAIGGIQANSARALLNAGVASLAVSQGIFGESCGPFHATRKFMEALTT